MHLVGFIIRKKVYLRTGHAGPEGEPRYSSTLSLKATPWLLYPWETDTVFIVQDAGWDPGPAWTGAENSPLTGIRSPDRTARSESLYRLRYPGPQ